MLQLIETGFIAGTVFAVEVIIVVSFLSLLYWLLCWLTHPEEVKLQKQRILSHQLYKVSGRGRVAYLILCLERTLQFYKQDLTDWEWLLRKLWSITNMNNPDDSWIDVWLDTTGDLLPCDVLSLNNGKGSTILEIEKAQKLYTNAGYAMIVINTIFNSIYDMVATWGPDTELHDPDAFYYIDKAEDIMREFRISLPSNEIIYRLLLEQKDPLFGKPFDGLRYSSILS